ncbi:hypothetical protein [Paenarthrobacter nitroguajacolicus]
MKTSNIRRKGWNPMNRSEPTSRSRQGLRVVHLEGTISKAEAGDGTTEY